MKIGIPKEKKKNEYRVALIPIDVKKLVDFGFSVAVEKGAGAGSGFPDEEYRAAGAEILGNVYGCDMIVRVKEPKINTIRQNQTIMGYLHVEKGQNPELLNTLLEKNATSYAYEEIRDCNYDRLVNLGFEAGVVGMFEGLRLWGKLQGKNDIFKDLPAIRKSGKKEGYENLKKVFGTSKIKVAIMGNGRVGAGVLDVLKRARIEPIILDRTKTPHLAEYLADIDILVNAVVWYPTDPQLLTRPMLKLMKKNSLIVDISCDKDGAVQTCIPTTWDDPYYKLDGITHLCIDNLPSAIPRESSIHLSTMIMPFVLAVANKEKLMTGLMTKNMQFLYKNKLEEGVKVEIVKQVASA